jgi:hypothetical protein
MFLNIFKLKGQNFAGGYFYRLFLIFPSFKFVKLRALWIIFPRALKVLALIQIINN